MNLHYFSRTPSSQHQADVNSYNWGIWEGSPKSSGEFTSLQQIGQWLFGLDWCAWVSNVLVGSAQHPLSPLFPRTPFTITNTGGEPLCK